nr:MAG TPA: hypothetical protein [Caudoviricetes sp.]
MMKYVVCRTNNSDQLRTAVQISNSPMLSYLAV